MSEWLEIERRFEYLTKRCNIRPVPMIHSSTRQKQERRGQLSDETFAKIVAAHVVNADKSGELG